MSVPSSVIHIISGVPLNNSYDHTLFFDYETQNRPTARAQQTEYFLSKKVKTFDKFTYLRPGNIIKVAGDVANARSWNYLMFQNDTGKWYYHFINKVTYLSDSSVELHIELDVIQTYMFDWSLEQCLVERMHTATDRIGEHTLEEGLECGEHVDTVTLEYLFEDLCVLWLSACDTSGNSNFGNTYDGVYSGLIMYASDDPEAISNYLDFMDQQGKTEAIVSMWMYPKSLVNIGGAWKENAIHRVVGYSDSDEALGFTESSDLDGYAPKNNKLFTYPYCFVYASNNMGGSAIYKNERFDHSESNNHKFKIRGALSPDSGVMLIPLEYNGSAIAYEHALSMGAFPTCAWNSDTYKIWLAQTQNTRSLHETQSVIKAWTAVGTAAAGLATGSLPLAGGALATSMSALNGYMEQVAQKADMEVQPPQAKGNHSGNINIAMGHCGFSIHHKTVKADRARVIDNFFTRYGYKVNRIMYPMIKTRERFTYIKTVGCFVTGNLGTEDQLKIQAIFDKGITFWHDFDSVGLFTRDNPCLTSEV